MTGPEWARGKQWELRRSEVQSSDKIWSPFEGSEAAVFSMDCRGTRKFLYLRHFLFI